MSTETTPELPPPRVDRDTLLARSRQLANRYDALFIDRTAISAARRGANLAEPA